MHWSAFISDGGVSETGSEGGTIMLDEEHDYGARITLERDSHVAPFAITCGIYGWMVHTRYFRLESSARGAFEAMKSDLDEIIVSIPFDADPLKDQKMNAVMRALSAFVDKYPTQPVE
tara:strand:+ start:8530 stop:8883 length:354 start_codon:yes stop_codon:yes gene_type:complete